MLSYFSFIFKLIIFISIDRWVSSFQLFSTDPDIDRNSTQLIESRGFAAETHYVVTNDGYVLTLFRIVNPFFKSRLNLYPVYMQYGILGNTDQWLISSVGALNLNGDYVEQNGLINNCSSLGSIGQSLPFVLSACGYDVWLGNNRGSKYSSHIVLNQNRDKKYWSFNLDHYTYDVAANIQFILGKTKSETIGYIGFSLGSGTMFQLLSTQTEYSKVFKPFISMAPFVYLGDIQSPLLRLFGIFEPILRLKPFRVGGLGRAQPLFGRYFCGNTILKEICFLIYSLIGGFDIQSLDKSVLPRLWAHFPDAISSIASAHVGQRIATKRFSFYDYGVEENLRIYGQKGSPDYNISRIDSNYIVLMSGVNDFLSDPTDDDILRSQLSVTPYVDYVVPDPYWTHGDFVHANSAGKYINSPILRILESLNLNNYFKEKQNLSKF